MRFNSLNAWLDWQETLHPSKIDLGLDRVSEVWQRLHKGSFKPAVISVAGTNGKGSCCAMLESIIIQAGYKVGCYTSPHIIRYTERIRLQGREIDDGQLCLAFEAVDQARHTTSLTYFEFGTLAALSCFDQAGLDVVILEVGLGGRLDAVNIIDADVALLTSIGLDHQEWLGTDCEQIGREKAGIFRAGKPAVCAQQSLPDSVLKAARQTGVPCFIQGRDYYFQQEQHKWNWQGAGQTRSNLPIPALRGRHQIYNASAVLMVLECLSQRLPVRREHIKQGLLCVQLAGRFQIVNYRVPVILDVAHNPQAVRALVDNIKLFTTRGNVSVVLGMLKDKDVEGVATLLMPFVKHWYVVSVDAPRGLSAKELGERLKTVGIHEFIVAKSPATALDQAIMKAGPEDCVLACGSFYTVEGIMNSASFKRALDGAEPG
ncbi:MAG TPA: bifunctional tetrahydrofolate synthase/dihydrofolate synthase [Gammaproteobacteria bacterium]|nr:bifunctional tetrahydrofolate synthase/dihydrofolate synthase [Gammaproteobacteria bacterium]